MKYIEALEKLRDTASEAVEGDHIRPKGQRYDWLVKQMRKLVSLEDKMQIERNQR